MRVGIVGCGLIGERRSRYLGGHELVAVADIDGRRAERVAAVRPGCVAEPTWNALVARADIDIVIVSTTNNVLAPVTEAAVRQGKHVLVEKPAGRRASELSPIAELAKRTGSIVKVGFNLRFHPAFKKARQVVAAGELGPLYFIRGRYGHGGRVGYDREWRADPEIAGGGELLDQGVHLIDLSRSFLGDFNEVDGHLGRYFWDMPVEDNGFLMLKTPAGQLAWLHASCTEWKNTFSFEIVGRDGKLQVDGLGGSYGVERLAHYRMLPAMGPPETTIWEFPGEDASWRDEYQYFAKCVEQGSIDEGGLNDAIQALRVVERLYADAAERKAA
jgi:predicted dehydrogenase